MRQRRLLLVMLLALLGLAGWASSSLLGKPPHELLPSAETMELAHAFWEGEPLRLVTHESAAGDHGPHVLQATGAELMSPPSAAPTAYGDAAVGRRTVPDAQVMPTGHEPARRESSVRPGGHATFFAAGPAEDRLPFTVSDLPPTGTAASPLCRRCRPEPDTSIRPCSGCHRYLLMDHRRRPRRRRMPSPRRRAECRSGTRCPWKWLISISTSRRPASRGRRRTQRRRAQLPPAWRPRALLRIAALARRQRMSRGPLIASTTSQLFPRMRRRRQAKLEVQRLAWRTNRLARRTR
jgi:hypothetical protein